jgi:hypothetical protein
MRHVIRLQPDVTSEWWNMATDIFRNTTNTCFLTLFPGSYLFYEANVNKILCSSHWQKKLATLNWQENNYGTAVVYRFKMMDTWIEGCLSFQETLIHP